MPPTALVTMELSNANRKILSEGTNLLAGTVPAKIVAVASDVSAGKSKTGRISPLWDGHAAKRIADTFLRVVPPGNAV